MAIPRYALVHRAVKNTLRTRNMWQVTCDKLSPRQCGFALWGHTYDVVIKAYSKFHRNPFMGTGVPGRGSKFAHSRYSGYWRLQQIVLPLRPWQGELVTGDWEPVTWRGAHAWQPHTYQPHACWVWDPRRVCPRTRSVLLIHSRSSGVDPVKRFTATIIRRWYLDYVKAKLQFIHTVNGDGSKTAKKMIKKALLTILSSPECQC